MPLLRIPACRARRFLGGAAALLLAGTISPLFAASPHVELEIATERGFPITGSRDWLKMLEGVGAARVRLRGEQPGDDPKIETRGSGASRVFAVTGILTARQQLLLPGAKFSLRDQARLKDWLEQLQAEGEEGVTAPRAAFGLTESQILAVHAALAAPVTASTRNAPARKALNAIARGQPLKVTVDPAALQALDDDQVVADELQGLSSGTALAAVLRPYGLAFAPRKPRGGEVELLVARSDTLEESWPIGWPTEKSQGIAAPDLFKHLEVEIADTPLDEALEAVGSRLDTPLLLDQNSLAREGIDLAEVRVSLPGRRMFYKQVLEKLLGQARLKSEVRLDETDKPFVWITTIR